MTQGPRSPARRRPGSGASHPEPTRLADLADGLLTAAAARTVRAHLQVCPPCAELAESIEKLVARLAAEREDLPPNALLDWARGLPERVVLRPARRVPSPLGRRPPLAERLVVAGRRAREAHAGLLRLVADSWQLLSEIVDQAAGPALAGRLAANALSTAPSVRSIAAPAASLGRRRLFFSARPFDLDLQVDYSGELDPRRLHGQILPVSGPRDAWQGSVVRLLEDSHQIASARVDRRGEFEFNRIPPGRYRIELAATAAANPHRSASPAFEV